MRSKVHACHQDNQVKEKPPMLGETRAERAPTFRFRFLPNPRLFYSQANKQCEQRGQSSEEKQRPPTPFLEEKEVTAGGEDIACRVPLLKKSREQPPPLGRNLLHGQRSSNSPLAAHADPK